MKPTPTGWPRMSASVYYDEPRAAIDWLRDAFGFEVRLRVEGEDGSIHHCQLIFDQQKRIHTRLTALQMARTIE
jgi:uncharacterized glyoxalase superfamily protein PhnB